MKKFIGSLFAILLIAVSVTCMATTVPAKKEIEEYLDKISLYQIETVKNPSYGSMGGEWTVMGLARYGIITDEYISIYKANLKNTLKTNNGILSTKKYTEYARVIIALTSIEENPENFGGYNLLKPLAELDNVISQGANGIIYTLIALDCGGYNVPEPDSGYKGEKTTREKLVKIILNSQLKDGGWSLMGTKSDTDVTAITIQALAPYTSKDKDVKKAVNKGLNRLGELQQKDGGYKTGNFENCESTAQVLVALSMMNISIDDDRFVKNGNTVYDGLMQYYKDGGFSHFVENDINQMATDQAMYAMIAYYRSIVGKNSLYNMKDGISRRVLEIPTKKQEVTSQNSKEEKREIETKKSKRSKVETVKETTTLEEDSKKQQEIKKDNKTKKIKSEEKSSEVLIEKEETSTSEMVITQKDEKNENDYKWTIYIIGVLLLAVVGVFFWRKDEKKM